MITLPDRPSGHRSLPHPLLTTTERVTHEVMDRHLGLAGLGKCQVEGCSNLTTETYCARCEEELQGEPINALFGMVVWCGLALLFWLAFFWEVL